MTKTHKYSPGWLGGAAAGRVTCSSLLSHILTAAADIYSWPSVLYLRPVWSALGATSPALNPGTAFSGVQSSTRERCNTVLDWPCRRAISGLHTTLPAAAGRGLAGPPRPARRYSPAQPGRGCPTFLDTPSHSPSGLRGDCSTEPCKPSVGWTGSALPRRTLQMCDSSR